METSVDILLRLRDEMAPSLKKAGEGIDSLEGKVKKIGAVLAASFSAKAIIDVAQQTSEFASRITDMSAKVGLSVKTYQELNFAASQSGVEFTNVQAAIGRLSQSLIEDKGGLVKHMESLGLAVGDLHGLTPDQLFQRVGEAIGGITDPTERSSKAMEIFGRQGLELMPLFASDMEAARQQAVELGLVLSDKAVAAGDEFGDAMDRAKLRVEVLKAEALAPVLELFVSLPPSVQAAGAGILEFGSTLTPIISALIATGGLAPAITAVGVALKAAFVVATGPVGLTIAAITALGVIWYKWGDDITTVVSKVYTAVREWLQEKLGGIFTWLGEKVEAVTGFFGDMYDAVVGNSFVPDMVDGIISAFGQLDVGMVDKSRQVTEETKGLFESMADVSLGHVQRAIDGMGNALAAVITGEGSFGEFLRTLGTQLLGGLLQAGINFGIGHIPGLGPSLVPTTGSFPGFRPGGSVPGGGGGGFGFASGSMGFRDFGAGSLAVLHGREAVVPESQRESFSMQHSGALLGEIQGMRRDLADFPRAIKIAIRDARAFG